MPRETKPRWASCLYVGRVKHRRRAEVAHEFSGPLFMAYLDLDELPGPLKGNWLFSSSRPAPYWLRREDCIGDPKTSLAEAARDLVESHTGQRPEGPVRLLTHLRTWGHWFNPVSFYHCFDASGTRLEAVIADITNTPWGERHAEVLVPRTGSESDGVLRAHHAKTFHVSPFLAMGSMYDWRISTPASSTRIRVVTRLDGKRQLTAELALLRREITGWSLASSLLRYPFMSLQVAAAIYLNALYLWLRGAPYHPHPASVPPATEIAQ